MKYMFLLWEDESKMPRPGTPELDAQLAAYGAFYEKAASEKVFQNGDPLQPSSEGKTVLVRGGSTSAETGTFTSGAQQLIGYYVLDCKDEADAVAWAAKIPAAASGAIEVRPVWTM